MEVLETVPSKLICSTCRKEGAEPEIKTISSGSYCSACLTHVAIQCAHCDAWILTEESFEVQFEGRVCESCLSESYALCEDCGVYTHLESSRYSDLHSVYYCEDCLSEHIVYCRGCDCEVNRSSAFQREGVFYCSDCYEQAPEDSDIIQHQEFTSSRFRKCRSKRKFGVEIEAILSQDLSHLSGEALRAWSRQTDASLGEWGMEYASPILQGDDGFREIARFTETLKNWHYVIDKRCGLHVHIDGRDLTYQDIKNVLKMALSFEDVVYAMLPESRFKGAFSVPLARFPKSRFKFRVSDEDGLKRLWYGRKNARVNLKSKFHHSRYFGVNIHSWFFRRSIEFRYHSGTLNPAKITNFIMICQALVDQAKKRKDFKFKRFQNFAEQYEAFSQVLRLPKRVRSYVKERIVKFHPDKFEALPNQIEVTLQ